jgi:hypothetical protein
MINIKLNVFNVTTWNHFEIALIAPNQMSHWISNVIPGCNNASFSVLYLITAQ